MSAATPSRRKPENAARRAETDRALAKAYFDYALSGIVVTDDALNLLRANAAACSIIGVPRHRLLHLAFPDVVDASPENIARAERHFKLLAEQGIARAELFLPQSGAQEERRVIELASIDIGEGRLLHVFDDVSAQRALILATEQARRAADEANRAKSAFLANMSHEIRTPLNGVIGLGELLRLTNLDARQQDYVNKMLQSSHALLEILNDVLDWSKVEAGHMAFEKLPFDLGEAIDELEAAAAPMAREKNLELFFELDKDLPRYVLGDRLRLMQVLRNLVGNAIKFTAKGRVSVRVSAAAGPGGASWGRFSVSDSGIGISPEEQARLFAPFSQADASTTRRFGGTGLGLAISRMLAEGMGGGIEVRSELGAGSTFSLRLPLEACSAAVPEAAGDDSIALGHGEFAGARVLVVEDNAINRDIIEALLRHAGIEVSLAATGSDALQLLRDGVAAPDLIFMDVQMPVMDGLTATRALRSDGCTLPVMALTAGVSAAERAACEAAGMDDFLAKPIDLAELAAVLTRWLPAGSIDAAPGAPAGVPAAVDDAEFPGIDVQAALSRFLGQREVLARARDALLKQHASSAARLAELNAVGSLAEMGRIAHGLKGAAGNVGAVALAAAAKGLEEALEARDSKAITRGVDAVGEALQSLSPKAAPR